MINTNKETLYIDDCSAVDLAAKYGTPLFIMSAEHILSKCQEIRNCFLEKYENTRAAYAGKAFLPLAMCKIIEKEGFCLDVVSGGELYTAIKAGFPPERIEFNGNNKSLGELQMAIDYGVGRIIIDGVDELALIEDICRTSQKKVNCLLRISPGVDSHTHQYITTGNKDSKFGIPLDEKIFFSVFSKAMDSQYVNLLGFHFHLGSQLFDNESHLKATTMLLDIISKLNKLYSFETSEINIGGGFGIKYVESDEPKPYSYFIDPVMELIYSAFDNMNIKRPAVVIEPGRSIVGNAGITLYSVGTIKDIPDVRKYVSVDGGMTDNIRPALYDSKYQCALANRMLDTANDTVTVCGKCCESGDILVRDAKLPTPKRGDLLAVFATGAYCYAMASNYNKLLVPPVVLTDHGTSRLIVKGQTYDDLIERDLL